MASKFGAAAKVPGYTSQSAIPQFIRHDNENVFLLGGYWDLTTSSSTKSGSHQRPMMRAGYSYQPGRKIVIRTDSKFCNLITYGSGNSVEVKVDGVNIGEINIPKTQTYQNVIPLFNNLDGKFHDIEILTQALKADKEFYFDGLEISKDAKLIPPSGALYKRKSRLTVVGDSISKGSATLLTSKTYAYQLAEYLGMDMINQSIAGSTVSGVNYSTGNQRYNTDVVNIGGDVILVLYGTNDLGGGGSVATFKTDYNTMIAGIKAGLPEATIICSSLIFRNDTFTNANTIQEFNTAIQEVATANGVKYVDAFPWITSATAGTYLSTDKLHPTESGHSLIAKKFAVEIRKY